MTLAQTWNHTHAGTETQAIRATQFDNVNRNTKRKKGTATTQEDTQEHSAAPNQPIDALNNTEHARQHWLIVMKTARETIATQHVCSNVVCATHTRVATCKPRNALPLTTHCNTRLTITWLQNHIDIDQLGHMPQPYAQTKRFNTHSGYGRATGPHITTHIIHPAIRRYSCKTGVGGLLRHSSRPSKRLSFARIVQQRRQVRTFVCSRVDWLRLVCKIHSARHLPLTATANQFRKQVESSDCARRS